MNKYYLEITPGSGSEIVIGTIPDKVFTYIKKEFDGRLEDYATAAEEGSVPDNLQWISEIGDLTDHDDIEHWDLPHTLEIVLKKHGDPSFKRVLPEYEIKQQTVTDGYPIKTSTGHFFLWESGNETWPSYTIEIDGEFDLLKLEIKIDRRTFGDEVDVSGIIYVDYDGESADFGGEGEDADSRPRIEIH